MYNSNKYGRWVKYFWKKKNGGLILILRFILLYVYIERILFNEDAKIDYEKQIIKASEERHNIVSNVDYTVEVVRT